MVTLLKQGLNYNNKKNNTIPRKSLYTHTALTNCPSVNNFMKSKYRNFKLRKNELQNLEMLLVCNTFMATFYSYELMHIGVFVLYVMESAS